MTVTDILRAVIQYDPDHKDKNGNPEPWYDDDINRQEEIDKYNNNSQRFLFYVWGIFVTSYARRNLFSGILACGRDYIYADTDSLKILNYEKHAKYFDDYNKNISKRLEMACDYHGFDPARVRPKTIKGVEKPLGVWDDETKNGAYPVFKTLGAKRYMYLSDDYDDETGNTTRNLHVTVAGSNKKKTAEYLTNTYGKYYAFYKFTKDMCIPKSHSGRTSSCYIDYETSGEITDYLGVKGSFHELTSVHVEQTEYNLSIIKSYVDFFMGVQEEEYR